MKSSYDAVIVGSGPNGLAAGITLAKAGLSTAIFEAKDTVGGGLRSAELTLPGFIHDICSAVHPLAIGSPFFSTLPLEQHGVEWIHPLIPLAHPFVEGSSVLLERSLDLTGKNLGEDGEAYKSLMEPLVSHWDCMAEDILGPLCFPRHPLLMAAFAYYAMRSSSGLSKSFFKGIRARSLFAGLSAHSNLPLNKPITAAFGMILGTLGHVVGWPFPKGGSQKIADALAAIFCSYSGEIYTQVNIQRIEELPPSKLIFLDITPKQFLNIAGHLLPSRYKQKLEAYRYGPGVFKMDWALNHPIPWKSADCEKAGTVHIGGIAEEIERSELEVSEGKHPKKPYVILAQQSLFDPTRAPQGKHTAWGYCHVPNGSEIDMTENIEDQIERFAPGFKDCIIAKNTRNTLELERYNPNCIGGDINGGMQDLHQLFTRPVARIVPYSTPLKGVFICSSSTPPGGGVHGMCGYHAALAGLRG